MAEIGSVAVATIEGLVGGTPGAAPGAAPTPAAPDDVARFEAAMGGGQPQPPPVGDPSQVDASQSGVSQVDATQAGPTPIEPAAPGSAAAPTSPGDTILQSLQRMSQDYRGTMDGVSKSLGAVQPGGVMNSAELMKIQFALTQVSMQQDLTAKVTGKVTQNLDTFLKNQ